MLGPSNVSRIPAGNRKKGRVARVSSDADGTFLLVFLSGQVVVDGGRAQDIRSTCRQREETSSPKD